MNTKVKAKWLGHAAVHLISPAGKHILIDPFLSQSPTTPSEFKTFDQVDYILLTHGHEDHVGDTLDIAKKTGCKVLSIVELSGLLKSDGLADDQAVEMNKGGTVEFDDFKVTMTNANHSSSFGGRYAGEPAGLMIKFKGDITVYHCGDTNIMADFKLYRKLYKPDVTFIPIGDYYTMGVKEAVMAAKLIESRHYVPIHYGTFPPLTGSPEDFKKRLESKGDFVVHVTKPGEVIF